MRKPGTKKRKARAMQRWQAKRCRWIPPREDVSAHRRWTTRTRLKWDSTVYTRVDMESFKQRDTESK